MAVALTKALAARLSAESIDSDVFCDAFERWKAGFPDSEFKSCLFGKDGAYTRPHVDGKPNVLRHVHLEPVADGDAWDLWMRAFRFLRRKTSDRALVYVESSTKNYLLIAILPEPDAHEVALMKTSEHKALMERFAEIASEFLFTGKIVN
jgi:mRNA interferase YafO